MHEHGLADHILEAVLHHPDRPPGRSPLSLTVVTSELSGLTQDALQHALDHVCEHEGLAPPALTLETVPLLGECAACGATAETDATLQCSRCGAAGVRLCAGELVLIRACEYAR